MLCHPRGIEWIGPIGPITPSGASVTSVDDRARYRANPSVFTALKSPRLLTREVLAGLVVGLALIPKAISFLGGRPAMITAATGAVALVIAPVAPTYGMDYFIATVILAGVFQVLM